MVCFRPPPPPAFPEEAAGSPFPRRGRDPARGLAAGFSPSALASLWGLMLSEGQQEQAGPGSLAGPLFVRVQRRAPRQEGSSRRQGLSAGCRGGLAGGQALRNQPCSSGCPTAPAP